jgi:glycosyltransferase involved in cell wall biosynthesis
MVRVVHNGVGDGEFAPVALRTDAADIVCVGELRPVKAIDVLIEALALLRRTGRRVSATIAGEGPEGAPLKAQAQRLDIADQVRFIGYCPAREAFSLGRMLIIPSRAESLPYVVLEAAAAGVPIIATAVGGVPEIFGPQADALIPPERCRTRWRDRLRARRSGAYAPRRRRGAGAGAQRVLLDRDGGSRTGGVSRSARDAKTRSIHITNF